MSQHCVHARHWPTMNFTIVKIAAEEVTDHEEYLQYQHGPSHFVKTEAFTILPPLSPKIPGPPPTPSPYRILPPIVSRKQPSFVIIQELGSRPQSREPSPSGRVSPFRGSGFKPSSTSREHSPSRQNDDSPLVENAKDDKMHVSRKRLAVESKKTPTRKASKSASPARPKSGIPVPLNRRISSSQISKVNQKSPLKSSENVLGPRPAVSESDLKSALRRSNTNIKQLPTSVGSPRKPPVPRQTRTAAKISTPKKSTATVGSDAKKTTPTASPARRNLYLGKNEALKKTGEGVGKDNLVKSSPTRPKTLPKSPSKKVTVKSKENLSPCSNPPTPMKMVKSPGRITKSPSRPPTKTPKRNTVKPTTLKIGEKASVTRPEDCGIHCNAVSNVDTITATTTAVAADPSIPAATTTIASSTAEDSKGTTSTNETFTSLQSNEAEKNSKPVKAMVKRVGRKALTTGNLIAALKKTVNEVNNKTEAASGEGKEDERKELPHMDTSRSLPISIATTNLTESSVTLIRTTTEPALAPVEPELISEIRSALIDAKAAEEAMGSQKEVKDVAAEATAAASVAVTGNSSDMKTSTNAATIGSPTEVKPTAANAAIASNPVEVEKRKVEVVEEAICQGESIKLMAQPTDESKDSTQPLHVVAVAKIEKPKQEMTSTIVEIKQQAEREVQSINASNLSENRNGISKSSWLNKRPQAEVMKKPNVQKLTENLSTESLMSDTTKPSRWHRFQSKCPKCFRRAPGTHPESISTITKTAADSANTTADSKRASFMRKYLFCVRCQCKKSSKAKRVSTDSQKRKCGPEWRCFRVFDKMSFCKRNKKVSSKLSTPSPFEDTEVACVSPLSVDEKPGLCGRCSGGVFKCLGILCCLNSTICVKMRGKCGKWCSCCRKCVCCGGDRKKKAISEAERRRSTISVQPKRKWTRYFTDFPKLDASFVEHNSMMRAALPVLPVPLAWICLILNVFLPGFGTLSSGIFCLFVGKPRFSINDSIFARIGSFVMNLLVASAQLFTVLFCLVGWGWSIWWGVMLVKMAKKNKRIILAEKGSGATHLSPDAARSRDPEKGIVSNG